MLQSNLSPVPRTGPALTENGRSPGRVLVVGDMGAQRHTVARALRAEGFEVVEVGCGEPALEAARLMAPDVVVLDVCRPDLDGLNTCRRLKAAAPALLPVLQLSARTSSADRARGLDAGADGYLAQPFDPNELRAVVSSLVRLKRQEAKRVADAAVNSLRDAFDALADHVALLGPDGEVIAVSSAWVEFAAANGYHASDTGLDTNYCEICERAFVAGADEARAVALGIRQVLADEVQSFELDYSCDLPTTECWFRLVVRRVPGSGPVAAITRHSDRTQERLAARATTVAACERERLVASLEAERSRLAAIFQHAPTFLGVLHGA